MQCKAVARVLQREELARLHKHSVPTLVGGEIGHGFIVSQPFLGPGVEPFYTSDGIPSGNTSRLALLRAHSKAERGGA